MTRPVNPHEAGTEKHLEWEMAMNVADELAVEAEFAVVPDDLWEGEDENPADRDLGEDPWAEGAGPFGYDPWHTPSADSTKPQSAVPAEAEDEWLKALESRLLDSDALDTIDDPEPLIHNDILFTDSLAWLVGKPGHGKSFITIDMAGSVATGSEWQGNPVSQGRVLYLVAEGARGIRKRVRAWEKASGRRMQDVDFLPIPVQATDRKAWDTLVRLAEKRAYSLIILDTQARVTVGIEENSNKEMGTFVHQAEKLRGAAGACVLIVHHIGRNGETGRGATTLDGALSTIMKSTKDGNRITLECTKQKDAEEWAKIEMTLMTVGDSAVLVGDAELPGNLMRMPSESALTFAASWWELHGDEWVSVAKLADSTDTPSKTVYRHKAELKRFSFAESREAGRGQQYRLPAAPSQFFSPSHP